jgi:hypothetical protein
MSLFVVSLSGITIVPLSSKEQPTALENIGCELGNAIMTPKDHQQEMVLATPEVGISLISHITKAYFSKTLYFFGPDGRGPCFIIGGITIAC